MKSLTVIDHLFSSSSDRLQSRFTLLWHVRLSCRCVIEKSENLMTRYGTGQRWQISSASQWWTPYNHWVFNM